MNTMAEAVVDESAQSRQVKLRLKSNEEYSEGGELRKVLVLSSKKEGRQRFSHKLKARPYAKMKPQHWVYDHFTILVQEGYLKSQPIFFFKGGKTFNREELTNLLKVCIEETTKGSRIPASHIKRIFQDLIREFKPELKQKKIELDFGYSQTHAIRESILKKRNEKKPNKVQLSGTSTTGYTHDYELRDSQFTNNTVFDISKNKTNFNLSITSNEVDFTETEPGIREMRVGAKVITAFDKYVLEDERTFWNEQLSLNSEFGFTSGASFSEGLTVGNMSLEGVNFSGVLNKDQYYDMTIGRTLSKDADKLMAMHFSDLIHEKFRYHIHGAGALYDDNSTSGSAGISDEVLFGFGVELSYKDYEIAHESVVQKTKFSHYLRAAKVFFEKLELNAELRFYDGVSFEYSSPDVYAGISGGDDVEDRGFALEGDYLIIEGLNYIFAFDSTFNGPSEDLMYYYQEFAIQKKIAEVNLSYEREWLDRAYNHISTFRVSKKWTESIKSTLDWSREKVEGVGSESVRVSNLYDAIPDILSFSSSYTNRYGDSGRDLSQQYGVNWTQSLNHFFSFQLNLSDPDATSNNFEINYLYKF